MTLTHKSCGATRNAAPRLPRVRRAHPGARHARRAHRRGARHERVGRLLVRLDGEVAGWLGLEAAPAAGRAEVERPPLVHGPVSFAAPTATSIPHTGSIAISGMVGTGARLCRRYSQLGEHGDRDLGLRRRAEVESGGAADAAERLLVQAARAQRREHGGPRASRSRPGRCSRRRPRVASSTSSSPWPIMPICFLGLQAGLARHPPPRLRREPCECLGRGARAHDREQRLRRLPKTAGLVTPSDAQLDAATTVSGSAPSAARPAGPMEARLAVAEAQERLAHDRPSRHRRPSRRSRRQ